MVAITGSQAFVNHRGIRLTTRLTDFSGYWILLVAAALTGAMLFFGKHLAPGNLVHVANYSGARGGRRCGRRRRSVPWLFVLGFLLPAYTITGFDASAHTAEETIGASVSVPRGIVRSVLVSGLCGWAMLAAVVVAIPDLDEAASKGRRRLRLRRRRRRAGQGGARALRRARGGAVPLRPRHGHLGVAHGVRVRARRGPAVLGGAARASARSTARRRGAVWATALLSIVFTVYTPVYSTIAAVCTIFLYLSYVIPTALGFFAWGRTWTAMGPWGLGRWYRPAALVAVLFCGLLIVVGVQPPNDKALWIVLGAAVVLAAGWFGRERRRFAGPPEGVARR